MHTTLAVTRTATLAAPPPAVVDVAGDPRTFPHWAPAFATAVRPAAGGVWLVDTGKTELRVRVRVARELGTVDILAADEERGAFMRVLPNGAGSEVVFTVFLPPEATAHDATRQAQVLDAELERLGALTAPPARAG